MLPLVISKPLLILFLLFYVVEGLQFVFFLKIFVCRHLCESGERKRNLCLSLFRIVPDYVILINVYLIYQVLSKCSRLMGCIGKSYRAFPCLVRLLTCFGLLPMQVLQKLDMIRKNDIERILAERNILITVRNPFVVIYSCDSYG